MSETKRVIKIVVDTQNARDIEATSKKLDQLNRSTKSLAGGMSYLTTAFSGWLGFLGLSQLTRMSDEMQNIGNRLKIITGSTEAAAEALNTIALIADRTNQGIAETGQAYSRLAISLKATKATTQEVAVFTETLINSFRIAGATMTETTNTIVQLSQAFASGELRGQELRSVMEQNATLADILRQRLGRDVYEKARKGLISTAEVMQALADKQKEINRQALLLAPTFEQVLVKSMNKVSYTIGQLNEEYKLSSKFAILLENVIYSLNNALVLLGATMVIVAVASIPKLQASLTRLWTAMTAFAATNPYILALTLALTLGALLYLNNDRLYRSFLKIKIGVLEALEALQEWNLKGADPNEFSTKIGEGNLMRTRAELSRTHLALANSELKQIAEDEKVIEDHMKKADEHFKSLIAKLTNQGGKSEKPVKAKEMLAELNKALDDGTISLEQYQASLNKFESTKVKMDFREGKMDVFARDAKNAALAVEDLNASLYAGTISLDKYRSATEDGRFKILQDQAKAGKISLEEYNEEVNKLGTKFSESSPVTVGITNYMNSVGTLAENISSGITKTLSAMEDGIVQFVKTGKFNFKDFADTVIEEIIRIQVRMAIAGIVSNIVGAFSSSSTGTTDYGGGGGGGTVYAANGGIVGPNGPIPLHSYATGGIARKPQVAVFGEGRMPEAYVPLPNGKSIPVEMSGAGGGDTTVVVNVNVDSGQESFQASSQKAKALGTLVSNIVSSELIKQKRPGGLLAS